MKKTKLVKLLQLDALNTAKRNVVARDVEAIVEALERVARDALATEGAFEVPGVCKLKVAHRKARTASNPATGAAVEVPGRWVVKAKALPGFQRSLFEEEAKP